MNIKFIFSKWVLCCFIATMIGNITPTYAQESNQDSVNYALITSYSNSTLMAYKVNADDGTFTFSSSTKPFSPPPGGSSFEQMATFGKNVYVLDWAANKIIQYSIDENGQLTQIDSIPTGFVPQTRYNSYVNGITVDPTGKYLYITSYFRSEVKSPENLIFSFSIDQYTGKLQAINTPIHVNETVIPLNMTFSPTITNTAYLITQYDRELVSRYSLDSNGQLTFKDYFPTANQIPKEIKFSPSGKYAYIIDFSIHDNMGDYVTKIYSYRVSDDGQFTFLKEVNVAPLNKLMSPQSELSIDPSGNFLYILTNANRVIPYQIDKNTGDLTQKNPFTLECGNHCWMSSLSFVSLSAS
jgi:6-phosphogluconolactonase (cycloisomerase 2 family)